MSKQFSGRDSADSTFSKEDEYEQLANSLTGTNICLATVMLMDEKLHSLTKEEIECIRMVQTTSQRFETMANERWRKVADRHERLQ